jgi:hypothetical protein
MPKQSAVIQLTAMNVLLSASFLEKQEMRIILHTYTLINLTLYIHVAYLATRPILMMLKNIFLP